MAENTASGPGKCATVGCKAKAAEVITYTWPGEPDEPQTDNVCTPCADAYERRPALRVTRAPLRSEEQPAELVSSEATEDGGEVSDWRISAE